MCSLKNEPASHKYLTQQLSFFICHYYTRHKTSSAGILLAILDQILKDPFTKALVLRMLLHQKRLIFSHPKYVPLGTTILGISLSFFAKFIYNFGYTKNVNNQLIFGSKALQSYIRPLSELEKTIRRMILESYGLEKYMEEHLNSIECNFRFNKYTTPDANGTKFGLSPHTDKNLITFLDQNGTNGLEILIKDI